MRIAVLYHNDADGFGAAYACWKGLDEDALYIPVQYGQPVPELPETVEELYIVDFSYDRETCEMLATKYATLYIIDHHKSAAAALAGLPYATFEEGKSGAVLTWEHFFPHREVPRILQYVQDRDLWRFALPKSKEVNAYIATLNKEFDEWDEFCVHTAESAGEAIIAFQNQQISGALKGVRHESIAGYTVPVLNCTANVSEVGNELCKAYPEAAFSASYCDRADGKRSYSLRSVGEFDVSEIAKKFGGGGHRNAAGFTIAAPVVTL